MAFTRKHFNTIAGTLANFAERTTTAQERESRKAIAKELARDFANIFADDAPVFDMNGNRRFDRTKFLKACGVGD